MKIHQCQSENSPVLSEPSENSPVLSEPSENTPVLSEPSENTPVLSGPSENTPVLSGPSENPPVEFQITTKSSLSRLHLPLHSSLRSVFNQSTNQLHNIFKFASLVTEYLGQYSRTASHSEEVCVRTRLFTIQDSSPYKTLQMAC